MSAFDRSKYGALLACYVPRVITSPSEYEQVKDATKALKQSVAPEEQALLAVLNVLIGDYESQQHHGPVNVLHRLMKSRGHRHKDLCGVVADKGTISKILCGERAISKAQAKKLAAIYGVSPSVFL